MKILTILPIKFKLLLANVFEQSSTWFTDPGTGNIAKISNNGTYIRGSIYHTTGLNIPILSGRISPFRIEVGVIPANKKTIMN